MRSPREFCKWVGGFNLRKFVTNVPRLHKDIDDLEKISPTFNMNSEHTDESTYTKIVLRGSQLMNLTDQKVFGLRWNVLTDCLVFSVWEIRILADMEIPTKRKVTVGPRLLGTSGRALISGQLILAATRICLTPERTSSVVDNLILDRLLYNSDSGQLYT